jgi:hypothetical protein
MAISSRDLPGTAVLARLDEPEYRNKLKSAEATSFRRKRCWWKLRQPRGACVLSGTTITQLRDATYLIDIVARAIPEERAKLDTLRNLMLETPSGRNVPLTDLAPAASADGHRAGRRHAWHGGSHRRQEAGARHRKVPRRAAVRLFGGRRRHHRR